jgi:hypothetical protein
MLHTTLGSGRGGTMVGSGSQKGFGGPDKTSLELIDEEALNVTGSVRDSQNGIDPGVAAALAKRKSMMSKTLLSNFLLGISLMKNIALKYTNTKLYQTESMAQIGRILEIESRYGLNSQSPEIGISFLVNQHIKEILDKYDDPADVVQLTFTREFNNMLQVCLFIPFLHQETPRPISIPKSELRLDYLKPKPELLASILSLR